MKKTKLVITGATGFIGKGVIEYIKRNYRNCSLVAVARDKVKLKKLGCDYLQYDINSCQENCFNLLGRPDILLHLAWENLEDYNSLSHIEKILPNHFHFIKSMVLGGLKKLVVTGTCYEYGNQNGCLSEDMPTNPELPYSIAKDTLRKYIEKLNKQFQFSYQWLRVFFVYGEGQKEKTLFGQFEKALKNKEKSFDMSFGEQIRDYLHVSELSKYISDLTLISKSNGIINVCSGSPISVRRLVENWLKQKGKKMRLNLGVYPYPKHEPLAFWGSNQRLKKIMNNKINES